ncbi:DUF1254 domain-containing protein [Serratia proteamaculans]|uniref:DUF1254 domain-containing protein n=1 Tax=Serratia proteamaculans TaxID=28151 RepID=UPI0015766887|nr:DUF1254 domain-containing protein [Serratia proteamaculans]NTX78838.1 DUF1254 domain-containing protein [Serratia proteamaculans]NTZ26921.1 DUF1254 domain-containing protein [Serratia proteamaculans]
MRKSLIAFSLMSAFISTASFANTPASLEKAALHGNETIATPGGNVELINSHISDKSSQLLFDEMDLQRASQAYIWSTPYVSMTSWRDNQNKVFGTGQAGVFAVLSSYNEKLGIVTANLTTPYIFSFSDLSKGPLVINYPAGKTAGGILDFWQRPVADLGLTGPDGGKGGKYIIVGPEDDVSKYKADDTFVFQSATNNIMVGTRILDTAADAKETFKSQLTMSSVDGKKADIRFVEGVDKKWSATAPRGLAYWKMLSDIINQEPVREQDKAWLAMLEPLGIVKGKPFNPDARQKMLLEKGAALGELMTRNLQINPRYTSVYWPGTQWYKSFDFNLSQETDTKIQLDERATWFYEAVSSTKGMVQPQVGAGQVYMTTKRDSHGDLLRADKNYKLHVPKDVPVGQFWSLTLYSENTRRAYDSGEGTIRSASLDSRMQDLVKNADGSVDLYIGPTAAKGFEKNHMKTVGTDGWFVYFRLYAPEQAFFDKSFKLGDFQRLN